jgi:glutamate racemase
LKNTNKSANGPIGIFDSGIGGLTVAHAVHRYLPNEQLIYFGDTAHLPYGDKAPESIKQYSKKITEFLLENRCKMIVIACNTASSIAFDVVQECTKGRALMVDVIDPVVLEVTAFQGLQHVGVIGTRGTINSGVYARKLKAQKAALKVSSMATPLFVPVIEEGAIKSAISKAVIERYLSEPQLQHIETLILGCTHYPLMKGEIEAFYRGKTKVVDAADIVGKTVKKLLTDANLLHQGRPAPHHFYVSDFTDSFEKNTHAFFGQAVHLEQLNIWN